jgi:hypothetical protein
MAALTFKKVLQNPKPLVRMMSSGNPGDGAGKGGGGGGNTQNTCHCSPKNIYDNF